MNCFPDEMAAEKQIVVSAHSIPARQGIPVVRRDSTAEKPHEKSGAATTLPWSRRP